MKVIITGGTGLIGKALVKRLAELNHRIVVLTRDPTIAVKYFPVSVEVESWDGKTIGSWSRVVDGADVVINLAGESVAAKRWTPARKASIMNSRIDSTRVIVDAIGRAEKKPQLLINASAVGYYGNVESGDVVETLPAGNDFIANVCMRWEAVALQAERFGLRVVLLRIGIVLDNSGGA
ncbi:MAG: NAD-dependent epimerase/dehydratase family protein, partial [Ignavibacteriales bacterium]|nr:NAD-dependent epimerase/dehydratase family protein [Ignavibacteriales bacterium]